MKLTFLMIPTLALLAGPASAQDTASEIAGDSMGLLFGLLVSILIGAVIGWLASQIVKGSSSGFWGDVLIGIGGSILARFVLQGLGITLGGVVGGLVASVAGAVVLILIVRTIRRAS